MHKGLGLMMTLGTFRYVDLKGAGKLGRIQQLWNSYCAVRLRIEKLEAALTEIQLKLVHEDPSFFKVKHSLAGSHSFSFRPKLKDARRSGIGIAMRNAIILRASSLTARKICISLDSYGFPIPRSWSKKCPNIKRWVDAYEAKRCRSLVDKLISDVRAQGRRLL